MDWYVVVKTINGQRYRYRQKTWREGKRVRTRSEYLGREELVGYHGTFAKFERFDANLLGSNTDCDSAREGFFFASNKNVAISYVSTHLARRRGLEAKIRTIEERIKSLTGGSVYEAELLIDGLALDVANKLKNLLGMMKRARLKLYENEITTVVQSKRGEVKRCKLDVRKPYVHDMKGRSYSEEEYLDAAFMAKSLGYDGVIIKNTYDPGSPAEIEGDDMTDIYVVFNSAQIRPA